jgi:hypothetical protein
MSDIESKAARGAVSECGQRASFNLGEGGLEVFDDFGGDDVGIGKVGAVFEALGRSKLDGSEGIQ